MHQTNVLCIVHGNRSGLGRFSDLLTRAGSVVETVNFLNGQTATKPTDRYDLIVVFGGRIGADDLHVAGLRAEYSFLESAAAADQAVLGLCLGGQLMSQVLGARPIKHLSKPEIGFRQIQPAPGEMPRVFFAHAEFFQWHWDDMPCPPGAANFGATEDVECQAFVRRRIVALQFHPDAIPMTIQQWMISGKETLTKYSAKSPDEHLADAWRLESKVDNWSKELLDRMLTNATKSDIL